MTTSRSKRNEDIRELVESLIDIVPGEDGYYLIFPKGEGRAGPLIIENYPSKDLAERGAYLFLCRLFGEGGNVPHRVDEFV